MPHPAQEEPLDLGGNLGWCHGCGKRRVLCVFGTCVACHEGDGARGNVPVEEPGHLCHGWYATGKLDTPWSCPTCGRVHAST